MKTPIFLQHFTANCYELNFPYHISHDVITADVLLHRHDYIEFQMMVAGHGTEIINGKAHKIIPGNMTILFPWHSHELIRDSGEDMEFIKCCFGFNLFIEKNGVFSKLKDIAFDMFGSDPYVFFEPDEAKKIVASLDEMLSELSRAKRWKRAFYDLKFVEILITYDRKRKSGAEIYVDEDKEIWEIIYYIHSNFDEDISISSVAKHFHYSESRINKLVYSATKLYFGNLLREIRIRNACALLLNSSLNISLVSAAIGYKSVEPFARAFKAIKGVSPEKYRKESYARTGDQLIRRSIYSDIIYYIYQHYKEDFSLSDVANHFHYSKKYLCELLTSSGQSFIDILHEIRTYYACALLLTTDFSVKYIGYAVGFNSPETFYRVYKKIYGTSPGEYRKLHK